MKKLVSLVVPFYNEGPGVAEFFRRVFQVASSLPQYRFEVVGINDGSGDDTWEQLLAARKLYRDVHLIDFSRNFGKEAALTAGLDFTQGDAVIPFDADLQHPPELIPSMLAQWELGAEVVLAQRTNRDTDGLLQKVSARFFYRFHNIISDVYVPANVGDFRLMDKAVVEALRQLPEQNRFMKGLFAWVGFRSVILPYSPDERSFGVSRFNLWKLWNFALEGITSFSTAPLRIWTYIGAVAAAISLLYAALIVIQTFMYGNTLPGYPSLMVAALFLGGVQLIGIGVLGEYVGRIYNEVKRRPVYVVREERRIDPD